MVRDVKKRSASKNVVQGLLLKIEENIHDHGKKRDIERMVKTINVKMDAINVLNGSIVDQIAEEKIEEDMEISTQFEIEVMSKMDQFMEQLLAKDSNVMQPKREVFHSMEENGSSPRMLSGQSSGIKLPKIDIKRFHGDPIHWQEFSDTFDAMVTKNETISDIQKFTYLRGLLRGEAEKCIEGITLTGDNFAQAMNLLKERYANPH